MQSAVLVPAALSPGGVTLCKLSCERGESCGAQHVLHLPGTGNPFAEHAEHSAV